MKKREKKRCVGRRRKEELFIDLSIQPRNKVLFFRVNNRERERYKAYAEVQGVSLSELIRQGLEMLCERQMDGDRVMADALPESLTHEPTSD